jgi:hypothetical protein
MAKAFESPVTLDMVIYDSFDYVDGKGATRNVVRKLIPKKLPTSKNESILFKVYEDNDVEFGLMMMPISEFNKYVNRGEFKIAC